MRALLVDKDNKPKWSPATLDAVTSEFIESFFVPLDDKNEFDPKSITLTKEELAAIQAQRIQDAIDSSIVGNR